MNSKLPIVSPSLLPPPNWKSDFKYDPLFDLGVGEWMGDIDIESDDTKFLDALFTCQSTDNTVEKIRKETLVVERETQRVFASASSTSNSDCDKENKVDETRKRKSLSLKKTTQKRKVLECETTNRFAVPVNPQEIEKVSKGLVPSNTETSTRWAVKNFNDWVTNRNERLPDNPIPLDLLECHDATKVCKYLCMFVLETRKSDGSEYPPCTIKALLSGLNRVLHANKAPFSILDKHNPEFQELSNTLDVVCSNLHRQGIGAEKHSAPVITIEDEMMFWEKHLLGYSSPKVLQRSVFFYVGLHFALRGVQEQHDLLPQQFARFPPDTTIYDPSVYYKYTEFISKNNQHRFKDLNTTSKVARAYAQVDSQHCVVKLLDNYLAKLPPGSSHFYMRPLDSVPANNSKPWYTKQRVGINKLKEVLPALSMEAGCQVRYTNHSLRATAATRMFSGGVPEKLIADKTGHRTLQALRRYEKTDPVMEKYVDAVISNPEAKFVSVSDTFVGENSDVGMKRDLNDVDNDALDTKESNPNPRKQMATAPIGHSFSGNLSNCTININYH